MLNQFVLVGKLGKTELIEINGTKKTILTLIVPRNFKNADGEYDNDYIDCILSGEIGKQVEDYCKQGDAIGVKGRIQSDENKIIQMVAEKITFLSSKKKDEKMEED